MRSPKNNIIRKRQKLRQTMRTLELLMGILFLILLFAFTSLREKGVLSHEIASPLISILSLLTGIIVGRHVWPFKPLDTSEES